MQEERVSLIGMGILAVLLRATVGFFMVPAIQRFWYPRDYVEVRFKINPPQVIGEGIH